MAERNYRVSCEAGRFANKWVAWRTSDGAVMTEGTVGECLKWIKRWGPSNLTTFKRMRVPTTWHDYVCADSHIPERNNDNA